MKKTILIFVIALLLTMFVSCDKAIDIKKPDTSTNTNTEQTKTPSDNNATAGNDIAITTEPLQQPAVCEHIYGDWQLISKATCTQEGTMERICMLCSHKENNMIEKSEHTVVIDNAVQATSTQPGLTEGSHCSACNMIIVKQNPIPVQMLKFVLEDNTYAVAGIGTYTSSHLVIPIEHNGISVTRIKTDAFKNCLFITSVKICNTTISIEKGAFSGCSNIESMEYPGHALGRIFGTEKYDNSVATEQPLYWGAATAYEVYYLPSGLKHLTITGNRIGYGSFYNCINLETVTLKEGLTKIEQLAFYNCSSLSEIKIPSSVEEIGYAAFSGCSTLEHLTLPFIGNTYQQYGQQQHLYPFGYIFGNKAYDGGIKTQQYGLSYGPVTTMGSTHYEFVGILYTYYIPESLKSVRLTGGDLSYGAFSGCTSIEEIHLSETLSFIANYAFVSANADKIYFDGTLQQWEDISKESNWKDNSTSLTICCKDGVLKVEAF